jgi:uroporphyrinogen-III synthase
MSVVVTRERGKNGKLIKALETLGIQCVELPLIEHRTGPDLPKLVHILRGIAFFVLHKLVLPFPHELCLLSHHFLFCV